MAPRSEFPPRPGRGKPCPCSGGFCSTSTGRCSTRPRWRPAQRPAGGLLAVTWLSIGVTLILSPAGSASGALGLLLLAAGAGLILSSAATASSKAVPGLVLLVGGVRFGLDGVYHLGVGEAWQDASAVAGLGLAALAAYTAWAMELEDARGKTVLPLGRRTFGAQALSGELREQVAGVEREPGVRKRL